MAKEDIVIDLASSDEESDSPPAKKMHVSNAMVHIPTKMHGVTIKPVKANPAELPKLGKNITITKTITKPVTSLPINKVKPPDKSITVTKKKPLGKRPIQVINPKGKVFNPVSQIKKGVVQSLGNTNITKLKNPIPIKKPQINRPQPLQRLPPSITIKKTGTTMKPPPNLIVLPQAFKPLANVSRKRKIAMPPVTLDDEEASTSTSNPQWYMRPEEQTQNPEVVAQEIPSQEDATASQQDVNNKEPEVPSFIEITIDDSPIKPPKAKRTRELSTEKVITIDDSPNKGGVIVEDVADGSDEETNTVKKVPQSKKKLEYESDLQTIEETHTLEIEFEPIELDVPNVDENHENKVISLTPEIMEEEQASVEIAQNKQGAVSVLQIKPGQSKKNPREEILNRKSAVKSEFHPVYQAFISLCIKLENSDDMEKIIEKKIKPYYRQVSKEYTESDEFLDMVVSKITAIEAAPEKLFLYIKDIVDELNVQRKIVRNPLPLEINKPKEQESFVYGREEKLDPSKQRQIRRLEVTLKKLNRAIHKLENQEVDFDDDEDSVYLLTEKYKERMVRVHAKFCQLTNTKLPTEPRLVIEARPGLSPAPARRLEQFINRNHKLVFPDFQDVLRCVREANAEDNLNWTEACIMEEARDLFVRCGRKLQRRRQENEWRLATSRITANSDPAEQSDILKRQLDDNRRVANTKETEVFEKYCDRQSQLKLEAEEIDDKEAEESPIESEEEDNDEVCSLESKHKRKERIKRLLQEISKKNNPNKVPDTEQNLTEEIEIESDNDEKDKIHTLSDDNNEIGSDMDELNLLQKLHSGSERRTSDTSDSESPLSISDTLESSFDEVKQTKLPSPDVVSIEDSSYSDESDSQKSNKGKSNKNYTAASKELREKSIEIVCTSPKLGRNTHTYYDTGENTIISSSDDESNLPDNAHSGKGDNAAKERQVTPDKDYEFSIMSETAELCNDINDCAKPSDAEDEQSVHSDTIDNRGSSASSGQFEELLKEHNADPLLKQPDLIPRDPSDKLFDSLVMKHYNDPLVKAHLKGSDSSNGDDPENSNSDTQSLNTSITAEEAKKDLIETSVDTEELLSVSPSMQIVDKFIETIKQSDGSQSSDELLRKVDEELDLMPDAGSPITLALEKAVTAARQTKAWPRFRDECSSMSSVEDDHASDNSPIPTKTNESTNDTDAWSLESTKYAPGGTDPMQNDGHIIEPKACSSMSTTKNLQEKMATTHIETVSNKDLKNTDSLSSVEENSTCENSPSMPTVTSESANDNFEAMDVGQSAKNTTEPDACSSKSPKYLTGEMATVHTEKVSNKDSKSTDSSISSVKDDSKFDNPSSMSTIASESTNNNFDTKTIAQSEVRQKTTGITDTDARSLESTKHAPGVPDITQSSNNTTEPEACNSKCSKNLPEKNKTAHSETVSNKDLKNTDHSLSSVKDSTFNNSPLIPTKTNETIKGNFNELDSKKANSSISKEIDVAFSETPSNESKDSDAKTSVSNNKSEELNVGDIEMKSAETNIDATSSESTKHIFEAMDIAESGTKLIEIKHIDSSEQASKAESQEGIPNAVSLTNTQETSKENCNLNENKCELSNPIVPNENSDTLMAILNSNYKSEEANDNESKLISNGNLNINMEISDLLHDDATLPQKDDGTHKVQDDLSANKDCDEGAVPRTITSVCLQGTEGNNL